MFTEAEAMLIIVSIVGFLCIWAESSKQKRKNKDNPDREDCTSEEWYASEAGQNEICADLYRQELRDKQNKAD